MKKDLKAFFSISPDIRYVAILHKGRLMSETRANLKNASGSDSDRYEELLVNPTLVTLLKQRGEIDCGGFGYVFIRYGNFHQLVIPTESGHLSVCIEKECNPLELVGPILHLYGSLKTGL